MTESVTTARAIADNEAGSITEGFSNVRLTGHDFLDIGTGNFTNTNYPGLPLVNPIPANEAVEGGGGRVFFTSTDQDGNFRVGDLFSVVEHDWLINKAGSEEAPVENTLRLVIRLNMFVTPSKI